MRLIYLVRAAQLLVTLGALSMLYSVSEFCERKQHTEEFCRIKQKETVTPAPIKIVYVRNATDEENADLVRRNEERGWKPNRTVTEEEFLKDRGYPPGARLATPEENAAHFALKIDARAQQANTTSSPSSSSTEASTTTAHESTSTESSTVIPSSEEAPIRKKRGFDEKEEAKELPDNGATEAKRKASVKTEDSSSQQEEAKEETKKPEKNPYHLLAQRTKKTEVKEEAKEEKNEEKNEEGVNVEVTTPIHAKEKAVEERKEEKKPDHPSTTTTQSTTEVKKESIETTTEVVKEEVKEHKGDKVEIPTTSQPEKDHHQAPSVSSEEKKQEDGHHTVKKDLGAPVKIPAEHKKDEVPPGMAKAGSSLFPSFIPASKDKKDQPHTTKKDLGEPVSTPDSLPPSAGTAKYTADDRFVREVRCATVETWHYFGSAESAFATHLKGLCIVGPVLVVICIYLVGTVLRTRLSNEPSSEYIDMLGCGFHSAMWLLVDLTLYFIYKHWNDNWNTTVGRQFIPEFPDLWKYLIYVSAFMMSVSSLEMWFHKYLHYDLTYERSYRCYEVIEPEPSSNQEEHFTRRTNVD